MMFALAAKLSPAAEIRGFTYSDGVRTHQLTLVTDEVAVRDSDARVDLRGNQAPTTVGELEDLLENVRVNEGLEPLAVLYRPDAVSTRAEAGRLLLASRVAAMVENDIEAAALFTRYGLVIERQVEYLPNTYIVRARSPFAGLDAANQITANERVVFATPILFRPVQLRQNDPLFPGQWNLQNTEQAGGTMNEDLNVVGVWEGNVTGQPVTGAGIVIGIVDEGLEFQSGSPPIGRPAHEDLLGNLDPTLSWDFRQNDDNTTPPCTTGVSSEWHGTAVAGVAAAVGDNGIGLIGVAPEATVASLRLPANVAQGQTDEQEADALSWQRDDIQIYNNSWGPFRNHHDTGPLVRSTLIKAVHEGRAGLGNVYTWAGGNEQQAADDVNYDGYANSRFTIAVAASDDNGLQSRYSEPGACLLVNAPSDHDITVPLARQITSSDLMGNCGLDIGVGQDAGHYMDPGDTHLSWIFGGTSAAAPETAGVAALMLDVNPNLGWRDVQDILVRTADATPLGDPDQVTPIVA